MFLLGQWTFERRDLIENAERNRKDGCRLRRKGDADRLIVKFLQRYGSCTRRSPVNRRRRRKYITALFTSCFEYRIYEQSYGPRPRNLSLRTASPPPRPSPSFSFPLCRDSNLARKTLVGTRLLERRTFPLKVLPSKQRNMAEML